MTKPVTQTTETKILPLKDILHRLDCFINQDDVGTIFPENFFTSVRHYLRATDWLAGYHQALEDAAKACENISAKGTNTCCDDMTMHCADVVRDLKEKGL